jgi:DNA repair exonuclease SbcCD ATPase subunit
VAAVLHRDAAPAAAAAAALAALTGAVNARLEQVGADYRVAVDASGDVECRFGDGSPRRRAGLLSPGQQMALALAWRVAVVDRYCPRAGVLCLDEPTTGLDETRIAALRSALDAWRAAGAGPQFLVVTHDRRLFGAFDRVVEL